MKIKVQFCWNGSRHLYRLLISGGLLVRADEWNRATASRALDLLAVEFPHVKRNSIRFVHV